jgi:hypothetical protein
MFAPTTRAHRIFIALLAFALAVALAIVASATPADAAKTTRDFSAEVTAGNPAKGGKANTYTVTFTNLGPTQTQQAGSFFVDFDDHGFSIESVDNLVARDKDGFDLGLTWVVTSGTDTEVVISAFDGGNRIGILDTVSVDVGVIAPAFIPIDGDPNHYRLDAGGDQEAFGNFKPGSNKFTPRNGMPDAQVTFGGSKVECEEGEEGNLNHCETGTETAANGAGANTECGDPNDIFNNCPKAGTLTVEADDVFCLDHDCEASWIATGETGVFYVIVEVALEDQGGNIKVVFDLDPSDNNDTQTVAKNCNPPKRNTNCIDPNHYLFERGKVLPVRFEVIDPRISY